MPAWGGLENRLSFVPRHFCEHQAHAAKIRDAGKHQTCADKTRQPDESEIRDMRRQYARENNSAGGTAMRRLDGNRVAGRVLPIGRERGIEVW